MNMYDPWIDITIDISKLEIIKTEIKNVLDTVKTMSVIDLPISLSIAYWSIDKAIKLLKLYRRGIG